MSGFQKLHHICIVVADIDRAQAYYESIGIGPWKEYPPLTDYSDLHVPNREAFFSLKYRVCDLTNVQMQLCQPDGQQSPQREFLDTKGEGVYHVGFEVPDADAAAKDAQAAGLTVNASGRRANGTGFDYYDTAREAGVTLLTRATPKAG